MKAAYRTLTLALVGSAAALLLALTPARAAQDKDKGKDKKDKEIKLELKDGAVRINGQLTADDPTDNVRQGRHRKIYTLKLAANKSYTVDLMSGDFDSYLRIEDDAGKQLAEDDDGGENLNSRLTFRAPREGTYRIIVTTFAGGETGNYTLAIRE
ncbi:MAG: PPC domain-containing protein [Gemmataceae bacterium]|nr:PPC domain-containing protein [Gemmataceae bacterium]